MSYFFVTLGNTYKHGTENGFLWSPKTKSNGAANIFYDNMQLVEPGDVIFAYSNTKVKAVGIASSVAEESGKPEGYKKNWKSMGWKVYVDFIKLNRPFRLIESVQEFKHLLPESSKSPIRYDTGGGYEGRYLSQIGEDFATYLIERSGITNVITHDSNHSTKPSKTPKITQKEATILRRIGQPIFRKKLMTRHNGRCQLTGVDIPELLIASHIKPWALSDSYERLDVDNGLLLVREIDALFDQGLLTFTDKGEAVFNRDDVEKYFSSKNLPIKLNDLSQGSKRYLDFHRARSQNVVVSVKS